MTIEIRRYRIRKETIDGKVYIDGKKVCDCAENARHCLGVGTHRVTHTRCVREDRNIPLIGHSACPHNCQQCNHLAHGNGVYGQRTGSVLLGEFIAPGCVKHSKPAFNALCERIRKSQSRGNEIQLTIKNKL